MAEYMKVINHGANNMDLRHLGPTTKEFRPVELHMNTNGAVDDTPTFAIVLNDGLGLNVVGQFSLNTLQECLNELGYTIVPTIK